jgi:hypothetical protein
MFRSPDVAGFPFVGGSTHTVITPLWMPGVTLPLADASATMVPNATTAPATSFHVAVGNLDILSPFGFMERAACRSSGQCSPQPLGTINPRTCRVHHYLGEAIADADEAEREQLRRVLVEAIAESSGEPR